MTELSDAQKLQRDLEERSRYFDSLSGDKLKEEGLKLLVEIGVLEPDGRYSMMYDNIGLAGKMSPLGKK